MNSEQLARLRSLNRYVTAADQFLAERDRYRCERDELLAVLFEDFDTRSHLDAAIRAGDSDAEQIPSSRQVGSSQSG